MNKNQIIFGVVVVILVGGLIYFFSSNSGGNPNIAGSIIKSATPSQTLVKFYELANQGLYSKLGELVAPQMTNYVDAKTIVQTWTNFGLVNPKTITKVAPIGESINGESAKVYFDMTLNDGEVIKSDKNFKTSWFYASLEKINGVWKINEVTSCSHPRFSNVFCHSITDGY